MNTRYQIKSIESIPSPSLIFFEDLIDQNIQEMIRIAGGVSRLRPHCKTHKTAMIAKKLIDLGIARHKCATIAEAEMLCESGGTDIFLAYNMVGPNLKRIVALVRNFPNVDLSITADHPEPLVQLSELAEQAEVEIGVVMDLDTGLQRTGISPDENAMELYEMIVSLRGIRPSGLHWYDGQHRQTDLFARTTAVETGIEKLLQLRDRLLLNGFDVPRIIVGGTGSFPIHAKYQEPSFELSPGTVVLHDAGYSSLYPDLRFNPAAAVLTRVISRPTDRRVTLDLGSKAIASDPPAGNRCRFPELPDAREVLQNEEHLVLETEQSSDLSPGDYQLAFPWHVCPTSALYDNAVVVRGGEVCERWPITARNRMLTV
ncbi:MAG: D-TA family PLP-dependent enzyme [Planctomycetota bacterium]|nr:D-TA family PLP-dependent enzyme [Planctomycetota bacterium]